MVTWLVSKEILDKKRHRSYFSKTRLALIGMVAASWLPMQSLHAQCTTGTTTCPTVNPQLVYNVCQNAALTIPSNVSGTCNRAQCCYNSATSNLSVTIVGTHTYVSDLRYWELKGTGPSGTKTIVLYNAGNGSPGGTNPVTTNDYAGNCNSNNNFNVTFS